MKMNKIKVAVSTVILSFALVTIAYAGQWKEDNGWKYQNDDGSYVVDDWHVGNDGNLYYLGDEGKLSTGWFQVDNSWYYATDKGVVVKDKWIEDADSYYYLGSDGKMDTNTNIGGYYVGGDGKRMKDSLSYEINKPTLVSSSSTNDDGIIPAGKYIVYAADGVPHVNIIDGSESIVDVYNFVELFDGDVTSVNGLYVPTLHERVLDIAAPGMFEVGKDISEGTYTVNANQPKQNSVNISICTVFNSIPSSKDGEKPEKNIVSDSYVYSKPITVTVKNGQFLQLINCTADLHRP